MLAGISFFGNFPLQEFFLGIVTTPPVISDGPPLSPIIHLGTCSQAKPELFAGFLQSAAEVTNITVMIYRLLILPPAVQFQIQNGIELRWRKENAS